MSKIVIHTDGGCRGNPGIGGWGVWLRYEGKNKKLKGSELSTTNNRMELTAAIKALEAIKSKNIDIDLFTDSKYVMSGINEWIINWKSRGWKTANKKTVKNVDLWKKLDQLNNEHSVVWHWVKGHSGDEGNEMADRLANEAMDIASN
ncbi:MAG TPA: ribonuclease HI [Gammaproteobacteria bacterium]|jgi:ribonuclease HI|nr:ribonuclease HI [Gammaproteobacteria bacterium]|tara:strand:+ start:336 stop:776 length:441 start_codon:yes stop_codon:yes gene_type:complete